MAETIKDKIPCTDCDDEKDRISNLGDREFVSCDPIPQEPGWCWFAWRYKEE